MKISSAYLSRIGKVKAIVERIGGTIAGLSLDREPLPGLDYAELIKSKNGISCVRATRIGGITGCLTYVPDVAPERDFLLITYDDVYVTYDGVALGYPIK